jgi:predicted kinase
MLSPPMEAVILIGIQGTGKSTFCRERLFHTHVRISLDMLQSRHREVILLTACLNAKQPFVIDNPNPTREERARYIAPSRAAGFKVTGYFFETDIREALARNELRGRGHRVPERGVRSTHARLQPPGRNEDFDALFRVRPAAMVNEFVVEPWRREA